MLSKKAKYGIKALIYICRHRKDAPIPIATIAEAEHISHKFLENILLSLKHGGILSAKKGKGGGYYLIKDPKEIFMTDIIRLLNGPIAMVSCVSLNFYEKCDDCPNEEDCAVNRLMLELRNSSLKVLGHKNLADIALKNKRGLE